MTLHSEPLGQHIAAVMAALLVSICMQVVSEAQQKFGGRFAEHALSLGLPGQVATSRLRRSRVSCALGSKTSGVQIVLVHTDVIRYEAVMAIAHARRENVAGMIAVLLRDTRIQPQEKRGLRETQRTHKVQEYWLWSR